MTVESATISAESSDAQVVEYVRSWLRDALPAEWVRAAEEGDADDDPGAAGRDRRA